MFTQTFVHADEGNHKKYALLASAGAQTMLLGLFVLLPLLYMQGLGRAQLKALLVAPPKPPSARPIRQAIAGSPAPAPRTFVRPQFNSAVRILTNRVPPIAVAAPPDIAPESSNVANGMTADLLASDLGKPAQFPASQTAERAPKAIGSVKVGGVVAEANLIRRVQPAYPPLAKAARVEGLVQFAAVISREGTIENLRLLTGHPLLVAAAREAILQWRYRPTLLNGQPVEVITEISVRFTLSQ